MKQKLTLDAVKMLSDAIIAILYVDGNVQSERELPFNVKYRLLRTQAILAPDVQTYENERLRLVKKYGAPVNDSNKNLLKVSQDNMGKFSEEFGKVGSTETELDLIPLKVADVDSIGNANIKISSMQLAMFMQYMVDDPGITDAEHKLQDNIKKASTEKASTTKSDKDEVVKDVKA